MLTWSQSTRISAGEPGRGTTTGLDPGVVVSSKHTSRATSRSSLNPARSTRRHTEGSPEDTAKVGTASDP